MATATEIENDYFTIFKSNDGVNFEEIIKVEGAGNSKEVLQYTAIDRSPIPGDSYYHLRQTDFDGKYEEFEIVLFTYTLGALFVYPNPVKDKITISGATSSIATLIFDMTGRNITPFTTFTSLGNKTEINVSRLHSGQYLLKSPTYSKVFIKE